MLKIVHIVFSMEAGGMENGIVNVANHLDPKEFEVHILCLERAGMFASRLKPGINIEVLGREGAGFSFDLVSRLRRRISALKPDLIHTHNFSTLVYGVFSKAGTPLFHGEHGAFKGSDSGFRRGLLRRLLYLACRKVHTVGEEMVNEVASFAWPRSKVIAIRNGVDTERFSPGERNAARVELGLHAGGRCIGVIGRFVAAKRHKVMIEAFEEMAERIPDLTLLLVGDDGPMKEPILKAVRQSRFADRIAVRPFCIEPQIYYRALDVLVAPSVNEGLSNVVLEAMAVGLPMVLHKACGNAEVAGNGAFAIVKDLGTPEQIAVALTELLENPCEMERLSGAARKEAVHHLSLEAMTAAYGEVYRSLGSRGGCKTKLSAGADAELNREL